MDTNTTTDPTFDASQSNKSADEQIVDLLLGEGETGDALERGADPDPKNEVETGDEPQDESQEDGDQPDPDDATEKKDSKPDTEDEPQDEDPATWASALGLEDSQVVLDEAGNFSGIKTKVGGEIEQVDLKELVKGYQVESYNTKRSEDIAKEREQFESYATQRAQEYNTSIDQAAALVNSLKQQLIGDHESINWEQLRVTDPAEYAARQQDMAVRYSQVEQAMQGIASEQDRLQQAKSEKQQKLNDERLRREAGKALEKKPEWADPNVRVEAMQNMATFIQDNYGYSPQEVAGISDHRVIGLIEDAMSYHAIKSKSAPKIAKSVPKFVKPGSIKEPDTKKAKLDKLYKKAAASSNRDFKDDAITQLLLNS